MYALNRVSKLQNLKPSSHARFLSRLPSVRCLPMTKNLCMQTLCFSSALCDFFRFFFHFTKWPLGFFSVSTSKKTFFLAIRFPSLGFSALCDDLRIFPSISVPFDAAIEKSVFFSWPQVVFSDTFYHCEISENFSYSNLSTVKCFDI